MVDPVVSMSGTVYATVSYNPDREPQWQIHGTPSDGPVRWGSIARRACAMIGVLEGGDTPGIEVGDWEAQSAHYNEIPVKR